MLKKRLIFTLLYDNGHFMLSRNFRLQKVGDIAWLERNYNFSDVAFFIDELIVLDVSRGKRDQNGFLSVLSRLSSGCFAPISAGGGVGSLEYAHALFRAGADKVVLNTALCEQPELVWDIASTFGQQCVVGSLDVKRNVNKHYEVFNFNGTSRIEMPAHDAIVKCGDGLVGEIYLNSMDRDGTGQGYDYGTLGLLPDGWRLPVIMAGGAGNARHFVEGLTDPRIDAVATANLFNFLGDGLKRARHALLAEGVRLASWPDIGEVDLRCACEIER